MLEKIQNKIVGWWVYRENSTGKWAYTNQHPGVKHGGIEGPMNFEKARGLVYTKNSEVDK